MKKILLFASLITALSFTSCSDDDNGGSSGPNESVKARIAGVDYTFDVVEVTEEVYEDYTDLTIIASTEEDPDTFVRIMLTEGETGSEAIWQFVYFPDGEAFETLEGFTTNVTQNDDSSIKGTFSGTVEHWDPEVDQEVTITNGEFTVNR